MSLVAIVTILSARLSSLSQPMRCNLFAMSATGKLSVWNALAVMTRSHLHVLNRACIQSDSQVFSLTACMLAVQVFDTPHRRQTLYIAGAIVGAVLLLYYLIRWRRA